MTDVDLYRAMKLTMLSSIRCSVLLARLARNFGRPVRYHGHRPHEPANYCMVCEEEVGGRKIINLIFYIIFIFYLF